MNSSLGEVIAERELEGPHGAVRVRIGVPRPDPAPGGDWRCPVEIDGIGDDEVACAFGADSLQALVLALRMADVKLSSIRRAGVRLTWLGDTDLGFPDFEE